MSEHSDGLSPTGGDIFGKQIIHLFIGEPQDNEENIRNWEQENGFFP